MANVSQIYKDVIDPSSKPTASLETELLKAEQQNILKWEEWHKNPTTREFMKVLEDARTELLIGTNNGREMTFGIPDVILINPSLTPDFIRVKLAEIGTLQKVLRASVDGKYNK